MEVPLITVLIPTYNRAGMLHDALESVMAQRHNGRFDYEIVVVDNASTDDTKAVVEGMAQGSRVPVKYVHEPQPGVAQARNTGLRRSQGAWIAFMDDDEYAEPDWLGELYDAAAETGAPHVGGAVHLDLPEAQLRQIAPGCRRTILRERAASEESGTPRLFGRREFPGTDNQLVKREVFDAVGDFDGNMRWGSSDMDFALRVRAAGYQQWLAPKSVVYHRTPPNRLTREYFRFSELKTGLGLAYFDHRYRGPVRMLLLWLARTGQAFLVFLPRYLMWTVARDHVRTLEQRCLLWRFAGYSREALALLGPKLFKQRRFFESVEFRKGVTKGVPAEKGSSS